MRKIATLDAFADTRVLFLGRGVCVTRLRNDPGHIAYARAQSRLVRYLFRGTRPAAGVDFARGGSSRLLAFDALPREGDPEFPRPVRAVPFEFDAFAPADAPEDLVVRLRALAEHGGASVDRDAARGDRLLRSAAGHEPRGGDALLYSLSHGALRFSSSE